jgi:aromatic amino acid transport protein AroP
VSHLWRHGGFFPNGVDGVGGVSLLHLKFRQGLNKRGLSPEFKSLWYPFSNYLCLAFVALILEVMLLIPGIKPSVYAIAFWLALLGFCYWLKRRAVC